MTSLSDISSGQRTRETKRFQLHPKQREFVDCAADICIYGGAAGGGKSFALLIEPIVRGLHERRGFGGVIFRRDSKQITNTGGLWDEAGQIYPWAGGEPWVGMLEYRFRAGAKINFRHIEHEDDKHKYQGSQICYLGFDELTHFTESQFWYLLSRNRSTCGVQPYVRATCNPDPGWVKSLLAPWVDHEYEGDRAASGEIRWFVRDAGVIRWVGPAHPDAKSLTFIRSTVYDNPSLNSDYVATLKALPPVERARLLDGDWDVRREGLVYPGFDQCIVDGAPDVVTAVGGIDYGFHNPFAAVYGFIDHDDVLWISGCRYQRQTTIPIHAEAIPKGVRWWCDPAQPESTAQLRSLGHEVLPCVHRPVRGATGETKKPILAGIDMVSERMRTGRLKIVRQACLPLVRELATYCYDPAKQIEEPIKQDDHAVDALRYLVVGLDRHRSPYHDEAPLSPEAEQIRRDEHDKQAQADPWAEHWWE